MNTAKGKQRDLVIDGQTLPCKYIGSGLFARAYRYGETVYLLVRGDNSKEAIALFCDDTLPHIPKITRHADHGDYQVFSMPYYRKLLKKDSPKAFTQWRTVCECMPNQWGKVAAGPDEVDTLVSNLRARNEGRLADAVQELVDGFANYDYDGMIFEVPKQNVSIDQNGELILRDCLASRHSIESERNRRTRRRVFN